MVARRDDQLYLLQVMHPMNPKPAWLTPEVEEQLRRVEYEFHVRSFGEEMARVNFLPLSQRKAYIAAMVDHATARGVLSVQERPDSEDPLG